MKVNWILGCIHYFGEKACVSSHERFAEVEVVFTVQKLAED
jgi:hypothetical protein